MMNKDKLKEFLDFNISDSTSAVMVIRDKGHGEFHATMMTEDGHCNIIKSLGHNSLKEFLNEIKWHIGEGNVPKGLKPHEQVKWIKENYANQ